MDAHIRVSYFINSGRAAQRRYEETFRLRRGCPRKRQDRRGRRAARVSPAGQPGSTVALTRFTTTVADLARDSNGLRPSTRAAARHVRAAQPGPHWRRNRFARWAHWYPGTPAVNPRRFQEVGEPYRRHWRAFPLWPPDTGDDQALGQAVALKLAELPQTMRAAIGERHSAGRPASEARARRGLFNAQQRATRNWAWAALREGLAAWLGREYPA
jgi:hypothetical protein